MAGQLSLKKITHEATFHMSTSNKQNQKEKEPVLHSTLLGFQSHILAHKSWFMCHFHVSNCLTETTNF